MKRILSQYSGLKKEVYILALGHMVTAMGSFVWPIMTFFLTVRLGMSDSAAAMVISAATVLGLPAALLGGKLADRFDRKAIIMLFDLLAVGMYLLASLLPVNGFTAVLIFLAALSQTMEHPAYGALNADFSTTQQREKAYSLSYLGYNLGFILGASAAGLLFQQHLRLAFVLNGLAIFISTVLIFFFVNPKNAVRREETREECLTEYELPEEDLTMAQLFRRRPVVLYILLATCIGCFPGHVVGVLLPLQLKQLMGDGGAAVYGYLSSTNGFIVILFTPVFALLLRRITELPKVGGGLLLFAGGMLLFTADRIWLFFAGMAVFSMGEAMIVLGEKPYSSRRVPASHRGRITGLSNVLNDLFSAFVQFATGIVLMLSGSNYHLMWMVFAGLGVLAAATFVCLYPLDRRSFPLLYGKVEITGHNIQK